MTQPASTPGVLGKTFALLAGAILLVLGFMFSLVLVAFIAIAALAALGYFWWKTRTLRKTMREQAHGHASAGTGQVFEGEAVVVEEFRTESRHIERDDAAKP